MSKVVKKNVIMDSDAMRRALVRIAHEIIEKNKDKAAAKAAKRKEKEGIYREKVLEASKVNAKNISSNSGMSAAEKEEKIRKAKEAMSKKEGSLASKVNMVSEFNKRNEK